VAQHCLDRRSARDGFDPPGESQNVAPMPVGQEKIGGGRYILSGQGMFEGPEPGYGGFLGRRILGGSVLRHRCFLLFTGGRIADPEAAEQPARPTAPFGVPAAAWHDRKRNQKKRKGRNAACSNSTTPSSASASASARPVGTCKLGTDPVAVIDPLSMKVIGPEGLRMADASAMPAMVSGNTYAATNMIAEKASDLILAG
jgi:GMC oxidoreductase